MAQIGRGGSTRQSTQPIPGQTPYSNGVQPGQQPTGQVGNQPTYFEPAYVPPPATPEINTGLQPGGPTNPGGPTDPVGGGDKSRWNPNARAQMDAVGQQYGYNWSDAEYDQWLGPNGYISKDDVDGSGRTLGAYQGGEIDPYWLMRMGYHARNEDYGGGVDQMRAREQAGLQDYGFGLGGSPLGTLGNSGGSGGASGGSSSGGSYSGSQPGAQSPLAQQVRDMISQLMNTGGQFNQKLVDQRAEGLREDLEGVRRSESQSLDAILAERGLTGSGGDLSARAQLGERLGQSHATQLRSLYSDEGQRADQRLMTALQTGAGLTTAEAQQAIDWYNAQTGRIGTEGNLNNQRDRLSLDEMLGVGGLGLGQAQLAASYGLGQGQLDLARTLGSRSANNADNNTYLQWLDWYSRQQPQNGNG